MKHAYTSKEINLAVSCITRILCFEKNKVNIRCVLVKRNRESTENPFISHVKYCAQEERFSSGNVSVKELFAGPT